MEKNLQDEKNMTMDYPDADIAKYLNKKNQSLRCHQLTSNHNKKDII